MKRVLSKKRLCYNLNAPQRTKKSLEAPNHSSGPSRLTVSSRERVSQSHIFLDLSLQYIITNSLMYF